MYTDDDYDLNKHLEINEIYLKTIHLLLQPYDDIILFLLQSNGVGFSHVIFMSRNKNTTFSEFILLI